MQDVLKENEVYADEFRRIFQLQKTAIIRFRNESLGKRKERLKKLRNWIASNGQLIIESLKKDLGKPEEEVKLSEIRPVLAEIRKVLKNLDDWASPQSVETPISYFGTKAYIKYEPKGVTLIMAPWNFPYNLTISPLAIALGAGNTAVIKPSERTPATSKLITKMVSEIFSEEEVHVFTGDAQVAKELLKLPFDHIFFTGSTQVGKEIMKAAANHLSSVTLELGGKSPAIVDQTANIEDAAEKIVWGKFLNCGQTCIAPDYIMVNKSVEKELVEKMKLNITKIFGRGKDSLEGSPDYGRLVDSKHYERLKAMLGNAMTDGATLVCGGDNNSETRFMSPTILTEVSKTSELMEEEIFGPILPVISIEDLSEAIDYINSKPKPLALYIFSGNSKKSRLILESTSSGTAVINDCVLQFSHPDLPFGGINHSGLGKSHGFYGFKQFSNEKSVLKQRIGMTTLKMLYPPYEGLVKKWVDLVTKYF